MIQLILHMKRAALINDILFLPYLSRYLLGHCPCNVLVLPLIRGSN